ncbi:hypothetical protein C3489_27270 [Streptomyces sp. Ru71]|nr:hypothetical protein C3489_27270 [Streptomyces sp. Ru71]
MAAATALLAMTAPASAAADRPGYGVAVEEDYVTAEVGGTVTVHPEVRDARSVLPEGTHLAKGATLQYFFPAHTTPVDLSDSCRRVGTLRVLSCTTVRPLTLRLDTALVTERVRVAVFPDDPWDALSNEDQFTVTAPVPREEGETPGSREGRQKAGAVLLGVGGGFALLALFLARTRGRRAVWASCTVVALVCAGPGVWSMTRGPLIGAKSYVRYPSGPPVLKIPETLWDTGWIRRESRPDGVPRVATTPDTGHEDVTDVFGFFAPYLDGPTGTPGQWLTVDGAYGRIEDPRRARDHMLRTAADAPGVTVAKQPRLFLLKGEGGTGKGPVLFKCQVLVVREEHVNQCAWVDRGVRVLLSTSGVPVALDSGDALLDTAYSALSVREYVQLGGGF